MGSIEYLELHKLEVARDIQSAEETLGKDEITEFYKERLGAACDAYQKAIDYLRSKPNKIPLSPGGIK
jgi:hypothetical protein